MTLVVAYVPRPEGQAALNKGIEIAKRRNERLIVVNASPHGNTGDSAYVDVPDFERVQSLLEQTGLDVDLKQFVRGKNAVEEIQELVESVQASLLVIGLRRRTPIGKLIMGSVAQELLLTVPCPILAVKAQ